MGQKNGAGGLDSNRHGCTLYGFLQRRESRAHFCGSVHAAPICEVDPGDEISPVGFDALRQLFKGALGAGQLRKFPITGEASTFANHSLRQVLDPAV